MRRWQTDFRLAGSYLQFAGLFDSLPTLTPCIRTWFDGAGPCGPCHDALPKIEPPIVVMVRHFFFLIFVIRHATTLTGRDGSYLCVNTVFGGWSPLPCVWNGGRRSYGTIDDACSFLRGPSSCFFRRPVRCNGHRTGGCIGLEIRLPDEKMDFLQKEMDVAVR